LTKTKNRYARKKPRACASDERITNVLHHHSHLLSRALMKTNDDESTYRMVDCMYLLCVFEVFLSAALGKKK